MSAMPSQITGVSIVCSRVGSDADQIKHHSSSNAEIVSIWWHHHVVWWIFLKLEHVLTFYIVLNPFQESKLRISFLYRTSTRTRFRGPVHWHGVTSSVTWISKYVHHKVCMKLLIHIQSRRCRNWSVGMDNEFHPTLYWACKYLSILGIKLIILLNKRHPRLLRFDRTTRASLFHKLNIMTNKDLVTSGDNVSPTKMLTKFHYSGVTWASWRF